MELIRKDYKKLRNTIFPLIFMAALMLLSFFLQSCTDTCTEVRTYQYYEPVYKSLEEVRSSVQQSEPKEIVNPGKIYYLKGYILINQPGEGIHVIDNRIKTNPTKVSFIEVPGSYDLAGKGDYIYTDSYMDMVILDFSNPENVSEVNRIEETFEPTWQNGFQTFNDELGVLTGWEKIDTVEEYKTDCDGNITGDIIPFRNGVLWGGCVVCRTFEVSLDAAAVAPGNQAGIGGSLARFTISGDYFYSISDNSLKTINISDQLNPMLGVQVSLAWGLETIFPYDDKLFIGSTTGMHIVDISNELNPIHESTYEHVFSCDPVVVQGDYAYVTLRSESFCRNGVNQLEVIDISDTKNPTQVSAFPMYNPRGLGVDGNALFICDGNAGLKVFNAEDKQNITQNMLVQYQDLKAIDVIPFNGTLMLIAEDGFYQYDYSDLSNIQLLSNIEITFENEQ